jgi:hypothetical protein
MSRFTIISVVTLVFAIALNVSANASPVKETLQACKNSPGCGYSKTTAGDYVGCSLKSQGGTGKCFYCNTQTNDCFQVRRVPGENWKWKRVLGNPIRALSR